jgi:hypothetical protein
MERHWQPIALLCYPCPSINVKCSKATVRGTSKLENILPKAR